MLHYEQAFGLQVAAIRAWWICTMEPIGLRRMIHGCGLPSPNSTPNPSHETMTSLERRHLLVSGGREKRRCSLGCGRYLVMLRMENTRTALPPCHALHELPVEK